MSGHVRNVVQAREAARICEYEATKAQRSLKPPASTPGLTVQPTLGLRNLGQATERDQGRLIDGRAQLQGELHLCDFEGCTAPPFQSQYLLQR